MLKSFWQFALLGCMAVVGSQAIAQTLPAVPMRQPLWSAEVGPFGTPIATPTQLLVASKGREAEPAFLEGFDSATGKRQWQSDRKIGSLFAVENQTIYADDFGFMGRPGNLLTLDAKTGKTRTVLPLRDPKFAEAMGVTQGAFIYRSYVTRGYEPYQTRITARTPQKVLWTFNTPPQSQVSEKRGMIQDGVVVLPILLYAPRAQRAFQLTALDGATGKLLWQWKTRAEIETLTLGDTVYASTYSLSRDGTQPGWVKAFDLKTGKQRWSHTMLGGQAEMANDREVFVIDQNEKTRLRYVVLDRQTGAVLRQFTLTPRGEDEWGGKKAQVIGNRIYKEAFERTGSWFTSENHSYIAAFDTMDGQMQWRTPTLPDTRIYEFRIMGDRLFIVGTDSKASKGIVQSFAVGTP